MRHRDHMRRLAPLLIIGAAFAAGCTGSQVGEQTAATAADSTALQEIMSIKDGAARMTALGDFVKKHPNNPLAGDAYPRLISLSREHAPDQVKGLVQRFAATNFDSPNPYNSVGWDLAEVGEHLDLAVPILQKAVAKARLQNDPMNLASCLDSEAWARHKAGDSRAAVGPMEEARGLLEEPNDELEEHMATIYEGAEMPELAQPIYISLLGHMEDPEIRARLTEIVTSRGGSMQPIDEQIEQTRLAFAKAAPAFTLPGQNGGTIDLAQHLGKVVILNFWHYT